MATYFNDKTNQYYFKGKYTNKFTGERKDYKQSGFKTEKLAKRAEVKFLELSDSSEMTMTFNYLKDLYIVESKKENKQSSIVTDVVCLKNHISPTFGTLKIVNIKSTQIMQWQSGLLEKNYSKRYVNKNHEVLSKILKFGTLHYGLPTNEAIKVKKLKEDKRSQDLLYWEVNTIMEFINCIENYEQRLFFKFLFLTGMRIGEFISLQIKDFVGNCLIVSKTLTYKTEGTGYKLTTPKTLRSFRNVYLDSESGKELSEYIETKKNIYGYEIDFFIFGNNRPFSTTDIARKMDKYINVMNERRDKNKQTRAIRITPHGLRHSLASYLISENENDSVIADRLGHTVDELRNTYAHVYKSKKIELTQSIAKLNKLSSPTKSPTNTKKSVNSN